MPIQKKCRPFLCLIVLVMLSGCESFHVKDIIVKDTDLVSERFDKAEPKMKKGSSVSLGSDVALDGSVTVFDMDLNQDYQRGVQPSRNTGPSMGGSMSQPMMSSSQSNVTLAYGEEFKTADSSVTIYGLDGDIPPHMGANPYGGNGYAHQGHSPSQSSGQTANQIFFKHGSSRLGSGDMRKISKFAEQAKFAPVDHVTVAGFASKPTQAGTNSTQAHIINLRQSMKRSEKVSKALMRKGVPGEKIKTVSWGASKATGNNRYDRRVDMGMGGQ